MDKLLTWFIYIWAAFAVLVNAVAIVGFFLSADTFGDGVQAVQETYGPFNIVNWILELVLISPAAGAYFWREKRRARTAK